MEKFILKNCFISKSYNPIKNFYKTLYHKTWPKEFNYQTARELENYWRPKLEEEHDIYSKNKQIKDQLPKKYVLSMFPYPSGRLHLGHVRVYTLSDVLARYNRMRGFYVIHPIGFDSFGLPAENAAIERNIEPDIWTDSNVEYMKKQLKELSFSFDWNRELSTCKKSYYKWTQYLFLQLYSKGIAFKKEALVNWDPIDKTVLANEQIDENGKSWRSGALVEKKILKQWFIKSSAYAKSLMDSMDSLNTDDWDIVKSIQKMWIGNCNGCFIDFTLKYEDSSIEDSVISVFTQTPQAIYGISHIDINKHHILLKNLKSDLNENMRLPCYALNPLNEEKIPIYLKSDSEFGILNSQGIPYVDSKLGIPSLIKSDLDFARQNGLNFRQILDENSVKLTNSNEFNDLEFNEAFESASKKLISMSKGGYITSDRLNDWCISRQRYWGCPIPLVYCDNCKVVPVPFEELPVELPKQKTHSDLIKSSWVNTQCPKCKGPARRETDTMDTFMDSSWYYLRYLDVNNDKEPFSTEKALKEMPVDIYIGGIEHAMTHLFVSRLISHFLFDQNKLPSQEPFKRFIAMGMVKGETFKTKNGRYVPSDQVEMKENTFFCKNTQEELSYDFEKMSKSKLNGIDPQFMIQKYGVDFTRLFLLSFVHPKSDRNFILSNDMVNGTLSIFQKIWDLVGLASTSLDNKLTNPDQNENLNSKEFTKLNKELYNIRNSQIGMINYNLNENFNLPSYLVAFSKIIKFLKKYPPKLYNDNFYKLLVETLILATPVIPHFTNECWSKLKNDLSFDFFDRNKEIVNLKWPEIDSDWTVDLSVKLNNKNLCTISLLSKELENLDLKTTLKYLEKNKIFQEKTKNKLEDYNTVLNIKPYLRATLNLYNKKSKIKIPTDQQDKE